MKFVLKGHLCYCVSPDRVTVLPNGYLVCVDGKSAGCFEKLPEEYEALPLTDCGDQLILPGLCDLHVHAPQFAYRGLGMDLELIDWLNLNAFPEESKYADLAYASRAYGLFTDAMQHSATTRACVFATLHVPATLLLMEQFERAGLRGYIGKVSMDRNSPDKLREASAKRAAADCESWLKQSERFEHVRPMLTPRFIPSCTDELMHRLGELMASRGLPLQSHLDENFGEIEWVKELCPQAESYTDAYDRFGTLSERTVMAHVVHPSDEEIALLKARNVMIAHCPASNMNIRSGIAPVRRLMNAGLRVGLGSDVAGGETIDMFRAMTDAIQVSKLRWRLADQSEKALTLSEALYLATKGGGAFFGKVGSFEEGYELDALVVDDSALVHPQELTVLQRLERAIYLASDCRIVRKYVAGEMILS